MPDKHAVLSASSCYRWLACPPSAKECAKLPDTSSEFARQGTDAHTLCEFKVKTALGQKMEDPTKSLTYFDEEMAECTDEYAQFVMECLAAAKASCKRFPRLPTTFRSSTLSIRSIRRASAASGMRHSICTVLRTCVSVAPTAPISSRRERPANITGITAACPRHSYAKCKSSKRMTVLQGTCAGSTP